MSAAPTPEPSRPAGRTWSDASPAEVRAALAPESAAEFDAQWRAALGRAAETYDLAVVHACLDAWRRVARVTATAGGADGYRAVREQVTTALETGATVGRPPAPWREVRVQLGL
ncbi:DUF6247 family protein [Actinomycetospora cinnamomea]|uniref:Uncharacterized protein n=1 Tax=Actinomycetospora cinnamomea TaxID=663609 RepID=A0A2U1E5H7_9PSEU|nr:DUF6247 family protein [Actinomycetospora cinnamomea]PVY95112.1 hypothetical protein C8D89_1402 [Actinomycetospora cinnamomea]